MSITTQGQIKKGIKSLKESEQFEEESLANIEKFFKFSLKVKKEAKKKIEIYPAFEGDSNQKIIQGEHLADFSKIVIKKDFLLDKFNKMCEIQASFDSKTSGKIPKMKEALNNGIIDFHKIQKSLAQNNLKYFNTLSKKVGVGKELLYSVSLTVFKPIFELCAEVGKNRIKGKLWEKGYCPICGMNPKMAKFEKEVGKRVLWCPLCGTEWIYQRIKCPFCENDNQKLLRFFYIEEESPYRVDVCDVCKGYIKTVNELKKEQEEKTVFEIENIKTYFLDEIAKKEGYKKI